MAIVPWTLLDSFSSPRGTPKNECAATSSPFPFIKPSAQIPSRPPRISWPSKNLCKFASTAATFRSPCAPPGHDRELAAGFLFTEGILKTPADVLSIETGENSVTLTLADGVEIGASRNFYTTSSCGVCGKASIDSLHAAGCAMLAHAAVSRAVIHGLPEKLRSTQSVFERTGGLHGAALFDASGNLELVREDVGRHNALDKLIGASFLDGCLPLENRILMLSGRASFELIQKAVMAGIPVVAAVGAPSSLAVQTALRFGMTLAGLSRFATND
jgi:FdhD protein